MPQMLEAEGKDRVVNVLHRPFRLVRDLSFQVHIFDSNHGSAPRRFRRPGSRCSTDNGRNANYCVWFQGPPWLNSPLVASRSRNQLLMMRVIQSMRTHSHLDGLALSDLSRKAKLTKGKARMLAYKAGIRRWVFWNCCNIWGTVPRGGRGICWCMVLKDPDARKTPKEQVRSLDFFVNYSCNSYL